MKIILGLAILLGALEARATDIVYDPINHGTQLVDQITNIAVWVKTEVANVQTQLNTLTTMENTVLEVERMGDPKTLTANLPGVSNIQLLDQIFTQANKDVTDWAAFVNPESWTLTANQILSTYRQPGLITFTASNGMRIGTAQSLFQFNTATYNASVGAQATVQQLNQKLQTLTQQLAQATSAMQSASTTSAVQKYQASISALEASIQATKAALQQAELSEKLQVQQNQAAEQITRAAQAQAIEASDLQVIDQGLMGLPMGQMQGQPILWNQNP
jgi:hypothetical protein